MVLIRSVRSAVTALAVVAACLCTLLALARPAPAAARTNPMALGFVDDPLFYEAGDGLRSAWLSHAQALGSSLVRIPVYWAQIAPQARPRNFQAANPREPSYDWGAVDAAVRAAAAHGQRILL